MLPCQKNCHAYCPGCHKSCPHFRAMQEQQHRDLIRKKEYFTPRRRVLPRGAAPVPRRGRVSGAAALLTGGPALRYTIYIGQHHIIPPYGLSTAPAAAARHLRCQNAR